jgi:hypothetical protein
MRFEMASESQIKAHFCVLFSKRGRFSTAPFRLAFSVLPENQAPAVSRRLKKTI